MTSKVKHKHTSWSEFGLSLILMAFAMAMYFRIFIADIPIGNFFLAIGTLLLFPYKNFLREFSTRQWNANVAMLMLFHLVALLYYATSEFNDPVYPISHIIILILSTSLIYTNYEIDFKIHKVVLWVGIESFICVALSYFVMASGLAEELNDINRDERIFDYLAPGGISVTNIACCIYCISKSNSNFKKALMLAIIVFDLLVITMSHKRTPFIVSITLCLIFAYRMYLINKRQWLWIVPIAILFVYVIITVNNEMFSDNALYVFNGVEDFINGTNQLEITNSASIRYYNREYTYDLISHFTPLQTIFGMGYMTRWIDNPLLQSYLDMGIFGFMSFLYFIVIVPISSIIKKSTLMNHELFWAFCMAAYTMIGFVSTGHPYGHGKWITICVLLFVLNGVISQQKESKNN